MSLNIGIIGLPNVGKSTTFNALTGAQNAAVANYPFRTIQPNRAIDSNYFSYTVVTADGLPQTGILTAETSTSVTLKQQEGKTITIPRNEIEELRNDGISFMPDGLEKNILLQDMADLIAFIKNWRYLAEAPSGGE